MAAENGNGNGGIYCFLYQRAPANRYRQAERSPVDLPTRNPQKSTESATILIDTLFDLRATSPPPRPPRPRAIPGRHGQLLAKADQPHGL